MDDQGPSTPPAEPTPPAVPSPQGAAASGAAPAAKPDAEWPARVADIIEDTVARVQDQIVRPVIVVGRGVVFGLIIMAMALIVAVLASVALTRLLNVYVFDNRVWASDALIGALFAGGGLFLFSRSGRASSEEA